MTLLEETLSKEDNPFRQEYLRKYFHDRYYYHGSIPVSTDPNIVDNFLYVRMHDTDNRYLNIVEKVLVFLAQNESFAARTGLDFYDLLAMDPSTLLYIQSSWMKLMEPEYNKLAEQDKAMKKLGDMKSLLSTLSRK